MTLDPGTPTDLLHIFGRRTVRRWHYTAHHNAFDDEVSYGWIADGRWWADNTNRDGLNTNYGRVFANDRSAMAYVEELLTAPRQHAGTWAEVPAETVPGSWPPQPAEVPPYPPDDPRSAAQQQHDGGDGGDE